MKEDEWKKIKKLLEENPPRVKLLELLFNPTICEKPIAHFDGKPIYPNCAGVVLYILDAYGKTRPQYVRAEDLVRILERGCEERRDNGSIFWMRNHRDEFNHFGILIGEIEGESLLFHKHDAKSSRARPNLWNLAGQNLLDLGYFSTRFYFPKENFQEVVRETLRDYPPEE